MYNENVLILAQGLTGVRDVLVNDWVGPGYVIAIGVVSLLFIKDRAWMKLFSFLGIAAVVAIPIFLGGELFSEDGGIVSSGKRIADQVNTVDVVSPIVAQTLDSPAGS